MPRMAQGGVRWGWLYSHQVFHRDAVKTRTSARGTRDRSNGFGLTKIRGGFQEEVVLEEAGTAWIFRSHIYRKWKVASG